jgi:hypothetical protein
VIWDTFMVRDEWDMLRMRIEQCEQTAEPVTHVAVEAPWTHRAVPKPLHLSAWLDSMPVIRDWAAAHNLVVVVDGWDPDPAAPWVNEHHQRNAAWARIDAHAEDEDWVLIADVDEIPSRGLLAVPPGICHAVPMRTFLFAVDWEVAVPVPPACVAAKVWWLRGQARGGAYLAEVRDDRDAYPVLPRPGGWHFSWVGQGGPGWQAEKLRTATCHTEILGTEEADLIRSGARWATDQAGGGLPVRGVDVDRTWPAYIADRPRRCPPEWFRPRDWKDPASYLAGPKQSNKVTGNPPDELDEYLAEAMRDPAFRQAWEDTP